ncbi:MAG: GYF domain-containing protein [Phycisphaerae bacterium]
MAREWYLSIDGKQFGPMNLKELRICASEGRCSIDDYAWRDGMDDWVRLSDLEQLQDIAFTEGHLPPPRRRLDDPLVRDTTDKKLVCGIVALFLGSLGIHKFILGYNQAGVVMLLCTTLGSCLVIPPLVMWVIGIVEGISYLQMSSEQFARVHGSKTKPWF